MSVARAGEPDVAIARRVRVRRRAGFAWLALPPHARGPYVVSASTSTDRGTRSAIARAPLP